MSTAGNGHSKGLSSAKPSSKTVSSHGKSLSLLRGVQKQNGGSSLSLSSKPTRSKDKLRRSHKKRMREKHQDNMNDNTHSDSDDDPSLRSLPDDVMGLLTSFLDVPSLLKCRRLNRSFRTLASRPSAGWSNHCEKMWKTKIHVLPSARTNSDRMAAYRDAIKDARERDHISREELIYDPETRSGTIWSFRFKESAGPDWTSWDPWYRGEPCRKMVFLDDGTVKQYVPRQQQDNDENDSINEYPAFSSNQGHLNPFEEAPFDLVDPHITMTWRYVTQPLDMPARPKGSYIRFSVGGREVPTYCVKRSPTNNWGFIMESCWGVYASFELPQKRIQRRGRRRIRRATDIDGNVFHVHVWDDYSSGDDSAEEGQGDPRDGGNNNSSGNDDDLLRDDSNLTITSGRQWREAYLYNYGTRTLPEGVEGLAEFDRIFAIAQDQDERI